MTNIRSIFLSCAAISLVAGCVGDSGHPLHTTYETHPGKHEYIALEGVVADAYGEWVFHVTGTIGKMEFTENLPLKDGDMWSCPTAMKISSNGSRIDYKVREDSMREYPKSTSDECVRYYLSAVRTRMSAAISNAQTY